MSERNIHGQLTQVDENGDVTVLHPYINASDDIVEGVLPIERGGTGASTSDELKRTIKNTIGFASSDNAGIMTAPDKIKLDKISTKSLYSIPYFTNDGNANGLQFVTGDKIEFVNGAQLIFDSDNQNITIGPESEYQYATVGYLTFKDSNGNWIDNKLIMYNGIKSVDMSESLTIKKGKYLFKYSSYYDAFELIGRIPEPVETTDIMRGANQYSSGEAGLVPAPAKNQHTYFLRGDGKWAEVVDNNGNIVATPNVDSATGTLDIEHGGTGTTTVKGIKELVGTDYSNTSIVKNLKTTLGIDYIKVDDIDDLDLDNYLNEGKYYFLNNAILTKNIRHAPDGALYPLNIFSVNENTNNLATFYLFVLAVDTDHTKQIISIYGSNPKTHIIFTRTRFKINSEYSWSEWVQVLTGKDIPVNRKTGGSIGTNSVSLGHNGTASGNYSVALGNTNTSSGENSTTSGYNNTASGIGSVALGANNKIAGNNAAGLGIGNITDGNGCIAIGSQLTVNSSIKNNKVYGLRSISIGTANTCGIEDSTDKHECIAVGRENTNTGTNSVAIGYNNRVSADYGFAIGNGNKNSNTNSFTAGYNNTASGTGSVAMGYNNTSSESYAITAGYNNTASGTGSVAMGYNNTSSGSYAITAGYNNTASGEGSAAIGYNNNSKNNKAYTFGEKNTVNSADAVALGYNNTLNRNSSNNGVDGVDAYCSGALGYQNTVNGYTSFALGAFNKTYSQGSLALGYTNTTGVENSADGKYAIAMGRLNTARGESSFATGYYNTASGKYAVAMGRENTASGESSVAMGRENTVSRANSFSTGYNNTCNAVDSFISGYKNEIKNDESNSSGQTQYGYCSGAIGYYLINNSYTSLVIGKFNKNSVNTTYTGGSGDGYLFAVGNGNSNTRSNAFRVNFSGLVYGGTYTNSGADYAEFIKPWYDNNVENEDRVGYMVTIKNGYLYKANDGDYIVGITSGNPSVIGNGDEDYYWKYERDEFNRIIYHEIDEIIEEEDNDGNIIYNKTGKKITVPKISSNYDSSLADSYIERKDRPEWSYVGMRGIIPVRDDGTCEAGGFCKCGSNGIATSSERGLDTYYVIERINDHVISVEVK